MSWGAPKRGGVQAFFLLLCIQLPQGAEVPQDLLNPHYEPDAVCAHKDTKAWRGSAIRKIEGKSQGLQE